MNLKLLTLLLILILLVGCSEKHNSAQFMVENGFLNHSRNGDIGENCSLICDGKNYSNLNVVPVGVGCLFTCNAKTIGYTSIIKEVI